ncbi:MAG TPA: acyl-CoA reductase [Polyangiaceae bacterium]|nr:acyl-CoA reductase [Polyangiaceae bacterium]
MTPEARERLESLLAGARRIADPNGPKANERRERLRASTGLSRAGVDLALARCLETHPSPAELDALASSVEASPRSLVLLSANVFVAAHRAIALALAASPQVCVRASRREPAMASFLHEEAPGLFDLVETLDPAAGDQLFAYGNASTLDSLAGTLPAGVLLRGHGPGFGLVVCDESSIDDENLARFVDGLSLDIVLFDQRGCLSPRLVLFQGSAASATKLAQALAKALDDWQQRVPVGSSTEAERAEAARYAATLSYSGKLVTAGPGVIGVGPIDSGLTLAPAGRSLHVLPVSDAPRRAESLATHITTFSAPCCEALRLAVTAALPLARPARPGQMQCPAFDGPVDRRAPRSLRSHGIFQTHAAR